MKMTRILGAALVLLSVKSMFSQGVISIKNHPEVHLVLNNNYSVRYDQNLRLLYEKADSVKDYSGFLIHISFNRRLK